MHANADSRAHLRSSPTERLVVEEREAVESVHLTPTRSLDGQTTPRAAQIQCEYCHVDSLSRSCTDARLALFAVDGRDSNTLTA